MSNHLLALKNTLFTALLATTLLVTGCGSDGGSIPPVSNLQPSNNALVGISATGVLAKSSTSGQVSVSLGSEVTMDGKLSKDADSDQLTYEWKLVSKPASSTVSVAGSTNKTLKFMPDAMGVYEFLLAVKDTKGATSEQRMLIDVNNRAPTAGTAVDVQFSAVPTVKPLQAISIGALITLDASNSTDAEGGKVTPSWTLKTKPAGSKAELDVNDMVARVQADMAGVYEVLVRGTDPQGAYVETLYRFDATNRAPNTVISTNVTAASFEAGSNSIDASLGFDILLNGSASSDPEKDLITYQWELLSKPANSALVFRTASTSSAAFTPDVLGDYVVKLTSTDSKGASSFYTTKVSVNNRRPIASITSNASPNALPNVPKLRFPLGTEITLRGSQSQDADGDPLTYLWTITDQPSGSTALLATPNSMNTLFRPDKEGMYEFTLKVQDTEGAYSEQKVILDTGSMAPVALVDRSMVSVLADGSVSVSAANSYDEDGDQLTYQWSVDARPIGSKATIAQSTNAAITFKPDMAGVYSLAVVVKDGKNASVAYVGVKALSAASGVTNLTFAPLKTRYSKNNDRLVMIAANPNSLKIVDPFTGGIRSIALPEAVQAMNISPDGKLAAVLHSGKASVIDLDEGKLLKTFTTSGRQTEIYINNSAMVYVQGDQGGQWADVGMSVLNGRTGALISEFRGGVFYGSQRGVYADKINKIFFIEEGLSPSDISYVDLDPVTGLATGTGDSPYHGDYSMYSPMFLTENQDYVFTSAGNYFHSGSLRYAGQLVYEGGLISLSHSAQLEEALVLSRTAGEEYPYEPQLPTSYTMFSGSLLINNGRLPMPMIGGKQSYARHIFHSANGSHIIVAQTGSGDENAAGVSYHIVYR